MHRLTVINYDKPMDIIYICPFECVAKLTMVGDITLKFKRIFFSRISIF